MKKENKIIEKKVVALSLFAFVIGIAIILPPYFTLGIGTTVQAYDEPWFNIEVPYAHFEASITEENTYQYLLDVLEIQPSINYNALNQQLDGRIEYLEYTVYTDELQLSKSTYCISINNAGDESLIDSFSFCKDYWFNSSYFDASDNSKYNAYHINDPAQLPSALSTGSVSCISKDEFNKILAILENTQIIYIDVKRAGYVTFDGDNTVVTLADNRLIQHIELTKNGNAFTFGDPESASTSWSTMRVFQSGTSDDTEFPPVQPVVLVFWNKNQQINWGQESGR